MICQYGAEKIDKTRAGPNKDRAFRNYTNLDIIVGNHSHSNLKVYFFKTSIEAENPKEAPHTRH